MDPKSTKEMSDDDNKKNIRINKKSKCIPMSQLSREELEARILQLEAHNKQLQNLLSKSQGVDKVKLQNGGKSKKKRQFDFKKHSKRHVLLKLAYLGWNYNGFAVQEDTQQTIEAELFSAFHKTRLIESRETSNYHRCGRTDKGVSAFDQVISITLRSKLSSGVGLIAPKGCVLNAAEAEDDDSKEINYVSLLNKVLPLEIRMLAWCPVSEGYSARFDCSHRTYKYFFPRGNLDIKLMNEAAQQLIGYHDYRNFCKMDVGNGVVNFCRRIHSFNVCKVRADDGKNQTNDESSISNASIAFESQCQDWKAEKVVDMEGADVEKTEKGHTSTGDPRIVDSRTDDPSSGNLRHRSESLFDTTTDGVEEGYEMCVATIEGQAFLWHQIRAIMAVLFMVGERNEEPNVIQELLNIEKHPRKPQYNLASDLPLNLYRTHFPHITWRYEQFALRSTLTQLQALWTHHSVRSTMIRHMLRDLETVYINQQNYKTTGDEVVSAPNDQCECLVPGAKTKVHRPLLNRPTCESLETRVEHYVKRRRLEPDILQKIAGKSPSE